MGEEGEPETPAGSSRDILCDAQAGRPSAIRRLWSRHLPRLRGWARGRLPRWARERADTDDLVQEVVVHASRHLASFERRGKGDLDAYLRRAVINRVRDEIRRAQRQPERVGDAEGLADEPDARASPFDAAVAEESFRRYEAALARLKGEERQAVIARIEMSLTYAEIATALAKPSEDAARMAVTRALQRLEREMNATTSG